jgi:ribosomal protein L18
MSLTKPERRQRIRFRIRKSISGTATNPRLSVFRSNKEIYAQLIDDVNGVTSWPLLKNKLECTNMMLRQQLENLLQRKR